MNPITFRSFKEDDDCWFPDDRKVEPSAVSQPAKKRIAVFQKIVHIKI